MPLPCQQGVGDSPPPSFIVEVAVPIWGKAKIRYMRRFRFFAMYVRTEPVHTYIAKSPKRAIYTLLYDTELVWVILTQTNRVPIKSLFGLTKNQVVSSQKQISKLK